MNWLSQWKGRRDLQRIVDSNRRSPATIDYAKRREAAKLGVARKRLLNVQMGRPVPDVLL